MDPFHVTFVPQLTVRQLYKLAILVGASANLGSRTVQAVASDVCKLADRMVADDNLDDCRRLAEAANEARNHDPSAAD